MLQAFIQEDKDTNIGIAFERKLYILRKKAEKRIIPLGYAQVVFSILLTGFQKQL